VERTIAYRLDGDDRISDVSADWGAFARENGAPELAGRTILGRSIWDFVAGDEARVLWSRLFARCRATRENRRLPYRCDGPDVRRFLVMALEAPKGSDILCVSHVVREESRASVSLLDPAVPRTGETILACSWCRKVYVAGRWVEIEHAVERLRLFERAELPLLTHGVCPACVDLVAA
jgi:hypothetical protein